ncbi:MAG: DUF4192 family protein, partial [Ornithinimicrobium sp.]
MSLTSAPESAFHGLPELIVALPYQLGYRPVQSLVLVCLGPIEVGGLTLCKGKVELTARVDLPSPGSDHRVLEAIVVALRRPQTRAVL